MTVFPSRLQLLLVLVLAYLSTGINGFKSHCDSLTARSIERESSFATSSSPIFKLRAGGAVNIGKRKKQKPTFVYMVKAFFRYR